MRSLGRLQRDRVVSAVAVAVAVVVDVAVDVQALIAIEASQAYRIGAVSAASRPVDARTSGGAGASATEGLLFG
jgi:hypothetical protein